MPVEAYQLQLGVWWKSNRVTTTFFFRVDNTLNIPGFQVATDLCNSITVDTFWFSRFLGLISDKCFVRSITCRQLNPTTPRRRLKFQANLATQGQWMGPLSNNFETATIQWTFPNDPSGKNQVRVGPIGSTVTAADEFSFIFRNRVSVFAFDHTAIEIMPSGLPRVGACWSPTYGLNQIKHAQLLWPPGRQKNRRWVA